MREVEVCEWGAGAEAGTSRVTQARTIREVTADAVRALEENGHADLVERMDYVSCAGAEHAAGGDGARVPFPFWRLVVFPVTGGSEGYYVHAGVIVQGERWNERCTYQDLMLAKSFDQDDAWTFARALGEVLQT